ncbi:MAG: hypothetical protein JKY43_11485 [Phycisphaerales bacterium]|nr:hypothetical protein [Phycisphaerales bacterium]
MESDLECKPYCGDVRIQRDSELSNRLAKALEGESVSSVGRATGYHPESIRRYIQGVGRVPADFVGQVVGEYNLNAHLILKGEYNVPGKSELRLLTTDRLINELGRRMKTIEDSSVGAILIREGLKI